jgi:hypothetical protein
MPSNWRKLVAERPKSTETLDKRIMELSIRGWYVKTMTHYAGRPDQWEYMQAEYPSRYGEWPLATGRDGELHIRGFMLRLEPVYFRQKQGYDWFDTGVMATLHDCLDIAVIRIEAMEKEKAA